MEHHNKPRLALACLVVASIMVSMVFSAPLDLGFGGIHNNAAANDYWARRFGTGFFANLARLQSSSTPSQNAIVEPSVRNPKRMKMRVVRRRKQNNQRRVPVYFTRTVEVEPLPAIEDNEIANVDNDNTFYRRSEVDASAAVEPKTAMVADDIVPYYADFSSDNQL